MQVSVQFLLSVLLFCRICFGQFEIEFCSEISTGCWSILGKGCVEISQVFVTVSIVVLPRFCPAVLDCSACCLFLQVVCFDVLLTHHVLALFYHE